MLPPVIIAPAAVPRVTVRNSHSVYESCRWSSIQRTPQVVLIVLTATALATPLRSNNIPCYQALYRSVSKILHDALSHSNA